MILNTNKQLHTVSKSELNDVITTNSDGSPASHVFDLVWDFSGVQTFGVGQEKTVSFKAIPSSGRKPIQSTLAYIVKQHQNKNKAFPTRSQTHNWMAGLVWVSKVLGSTEWASISDDKVFERFKRNMRNQLKGKSEGLSSSILTALNKLNEFNLCSRIFTSADLQTSASQTKQHIAIPISMYQQFINSSLQYVEKHHPYRHEINKVMRQVNDIHNEELNRKDCSTTLMAAQKRTARRVKKIKHNIPDFNIRLDAEDLSVLMAHCAIVVLAFSGTRIGELSSFGMCSYTVLNDGDHPISVLKGETTKGNEGKPKSETWQTHEVARDAIETIFDATQYLRDLYTKEANGLFSSGEFTNEQFAHAVREINSAFLAVKPSARHRTYVKKDLSTQIKKHALKMDITASKADVEEFNKLNPSREGQLVEGSRLPKLTGHDFRRTFAVFFKRYGFGSTASIKFQYKHRNINMSDYYANNARLQAMDDILLDCDLLSLLNEEGIEMGVDLFDDIYNKSEALSGKGGKKIEQIKFERLKAGHDVYMTRSEMESLIRNGTISVVRLPTGGYCLNSTCSRLCGIGAFASEIKPCEHQLFTDAEAKKLLRQNKRLTETFAGLNDGDSLNQSILIGLKQKIKLNEQILIQHNLSFTPFEDEVRGMIDVENI